MNFNLTPLQAEYLRELRSGPAQWFCDDENARALTRRGLARYRPCSFAWKYVITDKGRAHLETLAAAKEKAEQDAFDSMVLTGNRDHNVLG